MQTSSRCSALTKPELEAIRARADAATRGPWTECPLSMYVFGADGHMVVELRGTGAVVAGQRPEGSIERNATFVAKSRTDIPTLLAEVERLHRVNARLVEEMAELFAQVAALQQGKLAR